MQKEELEINETFYNLEEEKQKRIINAALKEFAENGYEKASTNRIVKNASIGKGMLFYYFNNKKELYYYLINYSLDVTIDEYLQRVDTNETDFIERLKDAAAIKMEYHLRNPNTLNFLGNFYIKEELEIPEKLKRRYEETMKKGYEVMYDNIDFSLFRDDVDIDKAFKLIQWSIDGYQNEIIHRIKGEDLATIDFTPLWDEFYRYLDILKTIFYK